MKLINSLSKKSFLYFWAPPYWLCVVSYKIKHFIVLKRSVADLKCCTFFAWFLVIKHIFQRRNANAEAKVQLHSFSYSVLL